MRPPFQAILCPTDFSEAGNAAVQVAYALAAPGAVVHLMHFPEPEFTTMPAPPPGSASAGPASAATERVAARLRQQVPAEATSRNVRTETHVIDGPDDPVTLIDREARRLGAQVVILGSHGRKGWRELLLGSVATGALRKLSLPVMLVRPPKA